MPRPGVVFGRNSAPVLEVKPDSPFVVFYGEPSEAQDAELTGKLVLTNSESMSVKSIRVTLTGVRKVSWHTTNTVTPQPISQKQNFFLETLTLFPIDGTKNKTHKINAGVHEWEFKFKMPSGLEESVEGLPTNWIVYSLKATVDRGYISKPLTASSHIRVIRTLGRDLLDSVPMEQINEDIWASKLAYKITVPQKNYIVGTSVTADFVLIPLRKGVQITNIKMELIESRQLFCDYAGRRISHQSDSHVVVKEGTMPPNSENRVPDGVEDADQLFDECHRFSMTLDLPKSLKNCRQSVDTENMRISHKLRLYVNLLNPEGHTSQLLVKNHVHLFISPNLPPGEDQSVLVDPNVLNRQAMQDEVNQNAPPTYGLHQLDELYNDIDPSGFMTPGGHASMANSGTNTPFYSHSRSGSEENLPSLDAVAGGASATALQHRLQNLDLNQNGRNTRFAPARQQSHHSSGGSTPHSIPDDVNRVPPSNYFAGGEYDMEALARTPSYNTAVRMPARTPISEDLPTYEIATSRPSSPSRTPTSRGTTPSPARSLDTLREETQRNTEMNSRKESPTRTGDDGR
ncbi:carbon catabolite repression protein-like protein cred [Lentithecium fluviatile CBS 122367]|uniref:Carbon catabolite repression protein-like protein cred n=1 Tax=Lentithecium fluviatile CBS 122367 TaxID=1168545 RepID=A0A6G1IS66_9PLEO|nr:carbon catabolite repression protein-like protein cred [Lentithecium fluviatile CBS 122367]